MIRGLLSVNFTVLCTPQVRDSSNSSSGRLFRVGVALQTFFLLGSFGLIADVSRSASASVINSNDCNRCINPVMNYLNDRTSIMSADGNRY